MPDALDRLVALMGSVPTGGGVPVDEIQLFLSAKKIKRRVTLDSLAGEIQISCCVDDFAGAVEDICRAFPDA